MIGADETTVSNKDGVTLFVTRGPKAKEAVAAYLEDLKAAGATLEMSKREIDDKIAVYVFGRFGFKPS